MQGESDDPETRSRCGDQKPGVNSSLGRKKDLHCGISSVEYAHAPATLPCLGRWLGVDVKGLAGVCSEPQEADDDADTAGKWAQTGGLR